MKTSYKLCLCVFLWLISSTIILPQDSYKLLNKINMHNLSANNFQNCLKTQSVALNPLTKKVYIAGILSNSAAILDLETGTIVGSIPLPKDGFQLMSLMCDPSINRLFAYTQSPTGSAPTTLYSIDLNTLSVTGTYSFGVNVNSLILNKVQHRIYCTFNNKTLININALNINDKQEVMLSFNGLGGNVSETGDTLYLASTNAGGSARYSVYYLPDFRFIKDMGVKHNSALGELGEVTVVPKENRVIMTGKLIQKIGNLKGDSLGFFNWNGSYSTDEMHMSEYDPVSKKIFYTIKAGYEQQGIGGRFSKLIVIDPVNLKQYKTKVGLGSSQLLVSQNPHRLVLTHMEDGNVWVMDLDQMTLQGDTVIFKNTKIVDVATSVENLVYDTKGGDFYISNRLGNNSLNKYNYSQGKLEAVFAGNWPVNVQIDQKLNRLFAYSHFESSFYVFDLPNLTSPRKIRIPEVPEAREDKLDDMVIDTLTQQLYVVNPEKGSISILNTKTLALLPTVFIPSFVSSDEYAGPHSLQLAYSITPNRLYCMDIVASKLYEFDRGNNFVLLKTVDLTGKVSKTKMTSNWRSVNYITQLNLLALGNNLYDPNTSLISKTAGAADVYVAASTSRNKLYFGKFETNRAVKILEYNTSPFGLLREKTLYTDGFYEPTLLYIPSKEWLVLGDMISSNLRIFDLAVDAPVGIKVENEQIPNDYILLENYPNPFNPETTIRYSIPRGGEVSITVHNSLGETIRRINEKYQSAGEHEIKFDARGLSSGIYFCRITAGENHKTIKMVLLK